MSTPDCMKKMSWWHCRSLHVNPPAHTHTHLLIVTRRLHLHNVQSQRRRTMNATHIVCVATFLHPAQHTHRCLMLCTAQFFFLTVKRTDKSGWAKARWKVCAYSICRHHKALLEITSTLISPLEALMRGKQERTNHRSRCSTYSWWIALRPDL